ncbi:MAG TPA: 1-acyl-sn-glycerol-3-phosphate acyltransferase [Candidatus Tetragenococcus pullicola]|nr:1-acyl-sn-glycerol-3-phosphate acyltransferase [Candidatus Tetragenococcus pullicola]
MFYSFVRELFRLVTFLFNGKVHVQNKEKLPQGENYLLVAPHRTLWDALYLALAARPKKFAFMAKKELFTKPFIGFFLRHGNAFAVDREKPGLSSIKTAVSILKETDLSLMIFPSGALHSQDIKGGATLIAKKAKVNIVPAVYQGPLTFKGLLLRRPVTVRFGEIITVSDNLDKSKRTMIEQKIQKSFQELDEAIDPTFVDKK